MIRNERQYKITKQRVEDFEGAIAKLRAKVDLSDWDQVQLDALNGQADDLKTEIHEYDRLRSGDVAVLEIDSFDELPSALVRARIAGGLTQRELAAKLGLKEQQIQRYEQTDYAGASIDRIKQIIAALGVRVSKQLFLPKGSDSIDRLYQRLQTVGLDRDFLQRRLLPARFSGQIRNPNEEAQAIGELAARVSRIYGWSPQTITSDVPLQLLTSTAAAARFKLPQRANTRKAAAYTYYAHYLALVVLSAHNVPITFVDPDPVTIRQRIEEKFGDVSFDSALRLVWELGIPVLPLKDPGAFHGACWRVNGRGVIVLKQNTPSAARWLIDLLHELYHILQDPETRTFSVVEAPEGAILTSAAQDEEIDATEFAGDIVLQNRADDLAVMCQREAKGKVEFLKRAVEKVADREGVDVGALANYMAYRLALQGVTNWWGTAANLQPSTTSPWQTARDMMVRRLDLSRIAPPDEELLRNALFE